MTREEEMRCPLCAGTQLTSRKYLRLNSDSLARNLAYAMPRPVGNLLASASGRFAKSYLPVRTNRQYFDRTVFYCDACATGAVWPAFSEPELSRYYRDFYWSNRDAVDGHHVPLEGRPNDRQLEITRDRMRWISARLASFGSVIDFGAGDCSAAFCMRESGKAVHVVDPSERAHQLAVAYGATYTPSLDGAPVVDLFYSAHSLEHVADLEASLGMILDHTREGGHVFVETPNIADVAVFLGLVHTPHTYMISAMTFEKLQSRLPFRIVAMEACGPKWSAGHPRIVSEERTDLRMLLEKLGSSRQVVKP